MGTDTTTGFGDWGFQTFSIPSETVVLTDGQSIADAITTLRAAGGGTLTLGAGTYVLNQVFIPSNVVIEGAGIGSTILDSGGDDALLRSDINAENIIFRDFTLDATGNIQNGLYLQKGVKNVLIEDLEIFGASKSNIIVTNRDSEPYVSDHITIQRVETYDAGIHGIAFKIVRESRILDIEAYGNTGYGIDISTSDFIEVGNSDVHDNDFGTKYPRTVHVYVHDTTMTDNTSTGIKFNKESGCKFYYHFEDNVITNSGNGATEFNDNVTNHTFAELVTRANSFASNTNDYWRIRSGIVWNFGDQINAGPEDEVTVNNFDVGVTPASQGVGYTTW